MKLIAISLSGPNIVAEHYVENYQELHQALSPNGFTRIGSMTHLTLKRFTLIGYDKYNNPIYLSRLE
jgi:hypothetical protein